MPSPFAERREDIVPRRLRDLIAADVYQPAKEKRRRRQRKTLTRRVT